MVAGLLRKMARELVPDQQKKELKFARTKVYEAFGSQRFSKPALYAIEDKLAQYLTWNGGTYVECGANDGFAQSNTYYLAKHRGWSGVLIEPVPTLYQLCKRFRPESRAFNCALGSSDGGSISINYDDLTTSVIRGPSARNAKRKPITVPLRTLTSVLAEAQLQDIDFFSLDVEGFEVEVLKGIDFERTKIKYILVETEQLEAVVEVLPGYSQVDQLSWHDYLFKAEP